MKKDTVQPGSNTWFFYIHKQYFFRVLTRIYTVKEIIATLTAHGILYKGRRFPMNTVYGILRNEKYSGTYMHGDEVVDKIYPPIVDPEIFAKVRAKVSCNKIGKHSNAVVNLLRQKNEMRILWREYEW